VSSNGSANPTALKSEAKRLFLEQNPQIDPDDALVDMFAANALLERKIDDFGSHLNLWTNAILSQTQLSRDQNQLIVSLGLTLEQTSKSNAALGQTLLPLKEELKLLRQEFGTLKVAISSHGSALQELNGSIESVNSHLNQVLSSQIKSLEKTLDTLEEKINSLPQALAKKIQALNTKLDSVIESLNAERWITRAALGLLLILVLGQSLGLGTRGKALQSQIESVNQNTNSVLIRLKRLEQK